MSCLYYCLYRRGYYAPRAGWGLFVLRLVFANLILALWLGFMSGDMAVWIAKPTLWRVTHLLFLLGSSVVLYLVVLLLCGIRPRHLLMPQSI